MYVYICIYVHSIKKNRKSRDRVSQGSVRALLDHDSRSRFHVMLVAVFVVFHFILSFVFVGLVVVCWLFWEERKRKM